MNEDHDEIIGEQLPRLGLILAGCFVAAGVVVMAIGALIA